MSDWKQSPHADVITRRLPCGFIDCPSPARWDVSVRRNGLASEWTPYCTWHAKYVVRRAATPSPDGREVGS